jgi:L-rhamnose mutarotase
MLAEKYSIFTPNNNKTCFGNIICRDIAQATKKLTKKYSKKCVCLNILTKNYEQEK